MGVQVRTLDHRGRARREFSRARRSAITEIARIVVGADCFSCVVIDISETGAKVWSRVTPRIGARVILDIVNFGTIPGIVVRRRSDGLGVAFRLKEEEREPFKERLKTILASYDKGPPCV